MEILFWYVALLNVPYWYPEELEEEFVKIWKNILFSIFLVFEINVDVFQTESEKCEAFEKQFIEM